MAVQRARLCIVSREPFRSTHFAAALYSTLGLEDDVEIIVDRRHGDSSGPLDPKEDRRRRPQVDIDLEVHGFAIVPTDDPPEPEPTERFIVNDEEDERLTHVRSFLRWRHGALLRSLVGILGGATLTALALLLAEHLGILGPVRIGVPVVIATSSSPRPIEDPHPAAAAVSAPPGEISLPPREAGPVIERMGTAFTERPTPLLPEGAGRQISTRNDATPADDVATSAGAAPEKSASDSRLRPGATIRPTASTSRRANRVTDEAAAGGAATAKAASTEPTGSPRVELVGEPVSRGWGDSYAVRLLNPAGQPVLDGNVQLIVSMADGTVENVPMGALAEPGLYRGTVPHNRATEVDLRVRVTTSSGSVEVPISR